jgi:hypothetical protein
VGNNRHSSRFRGMRLRRAEQEKKRAQQQVSFRCAKGQMAHDLDSAITNKFFRHKSFFLFLDPCFSLAACRQFY